MSQKKRVVIIGGGIGGITVAKGLGKSADVTVIERRTVYQYQPPALRAAVDETYAWQQFVPYPTNTPYKLIHASATNVEEGKVVLDNGDTLDYDILVIATGTSPAFLGRDPPTDFHAQVQLFDEVRAAIESSQQVLIAGGGPVGVELAGEIRSLYPGKHVTIVESGDSLLSRAEPALLPKMKQLVQARLESLGVKVILNAKVNLSRPPGGFEVGPTSVTLTNGEKIECDLRFVCGGGTMNNQAFASRFGSVITNHGKLRVNSLMLVEGQTNVFALGDIAEAGETGLAYIAGKVHAPVVVHNVKRLLHNKEPNKHHKAWKVSSMFVPIGPHGGVSQVGFLPFGNGVYTKGLLANIKNHERLFVNQTWKDLYGRGPPKNKSESPAFQAK